MDKIFKEIINLRENSNKSSTSSLPAVVSGVKLNVDLKENSDKSSTTSSSSSSSLPAVDLRKNKDTLSLPDLIENSIPSNARLNSDHSYIVILNPDGNLNKDVNLNKENTFNEDLFQNEVIVSQSINNKGEGKLDDKTNKLDVKEKKEKFQILDWKARKEKRKWI